MGFEYGWNNKEANFGPPVPNPVEGGTHITIEIVLRKGHEYIALRRPGGIPGHELPPRAKSYPAGLLYFCHDLIRYGESLEDCVRRIVRDQAGVHVTDMKILCMESSVQEKDGQWAIVPHIVAEIKDIPETSELVTEIVTFDKNDIPKNLAWWEKEDLAKFLEDDSRILR